ncbi:MAG: BACON domain-containing protein [Thermoanaerobaculia bacterium]
MRTLVRCMVLLFVCLAIGSPVFAVCPGAPTLLTPANNSVENFGAITFSWTDDPNAATYEMFAGIDGGPLTSKGSTTGTSKVAGIDPGRTIEWKVVANAPSCTGAASAHFVFTTSCPTTPPSQFSPFDGASFSQGQHVNFSWSQVPGAAGYDVKVSDDDGANWTILAADVTPNFFSTDSLAPGTYLWEVRANFNGDCDPLYSEMRTLSIADCSGTQAPELIAPANNATVHEPVTFSWNAVAGAVGYQFVLVRQKDPDIEITLDRTSVTLPANVGMVPGINKWFVRSLYETCAAVSSAERTFTLEEGTSGCPTDPQKATLVSPANGATNLASPITFKWNAVPKAIGYRVLASFGGNAPIALGNTAATQLSADVPAGTGYWLVQALFGDECPTTLSERRTLTVTKGATCTGTSPQLIAPANGATNVASPVVFTFTDIPDAVTYRLFVAAGNDEFSFYGETTENSLERFVPAGPVKWFVVAKFAACPEVRSATSSFIAAGRTECPQALMALLLPSQNATTTSPVHMAWSPVANAQFYRVWISIDGAAPVAILRTSASEADVRLPAGSIRWYVDAARENCEAVVSPQGQFTVSEGANCANNIAPVLTSPVGTRENPANATSPLTLSWNAAPNAIGYRVWLSRNLVSFEDVTLTKETHTTLPIEPGNYAWYVQAFFEGCAPRTSSTAFFRVANTSACSTPTPAVVSPPQGSVNTSPVTFVWTAVEGATKYRVFASLDDSEPQLIGVTDETQLSRTLPPGKVIWAVEAVFEKCPSTFSSRITFTIQQAQNCSNERAELVSPPNDATNVTSPVDFTWNPVSGAIKYVLVARVNDGSATALASTTDTNVTREMPPGVIHWRVVTFFAGCDPVESDEFRFTIARSQECDNRRPILILPADDHRALPSPVQFQWTAVPHATGYLLWARRGEEDPSIIASTTQPTAEVELARGRYEYFVEARFEECDPARSARGEFVVTAPLPCGTPLRPEAQAIGQALSNTKYRLRWTPLPNVELYEVQESTSLDFANASTFTTKVPAMQFVHEVTGAPVQYLYRVRGVSDCGNGDRGPYSDPVGVFITAPRTNNASAEIGTEDVIVQTVTLPGATEPISFVATSDKPWITITPSSGRLTADETILTVTADPRVLALGTNTGTIKVTYGASDSSNGPKTEAGTTLKIPISISLVTPVVPSGKGTPPPDSLIFPIVGHASGANNSLFESDIRVTNLTAETARYELNFTPSNSDGTQTGSSSTIEIPPNGTMAIDDVVASLFGNASVTGTLEVRPLTTSSSASTSLFTPTGAPSAIRDLATAAASRTYNFTPEGTFGQFIPAIRFADFVGGGVRPSILSLQQVAQSADYRANFGFAEASGAPADLKVRVYDTASTLLKTIDLSLKAGEHQQLNGMLSANGVTNLTDGRVEVEVVGGEGKVTAYVSELDNKTNDPLLVSAVLKGAVTSDKYVIPGVAYLNNPNAFWVSDLRIFNAGTTATPATVTFYPERNPGAAITKQITLDAGEIEVLDNVVNGLFEQTNNVGGSIAVTTPTETQLTATARTYNQKTASGGTYGQYIPGVTPSQSVGVGDRALQLLQLEQSSRFRTNIGLNETAGQPATIEVSAEVPDLLVTPVITINLQPNEFQQISLNQFGLGDALYNVRVTVKVIGGTGRVTAYGSAIDSITQDPTYVPAQ